MRESIAWWLLSLLVMFGAAAIAVMTGVALWLALDRVLEVLR